MTLFSDFRRIVTVLLDTFEAAGALNYHGKYLDEDDDGSREKGDQGKGSESLRGQQRFILPIHGRYCVDCECYDGRQVEGGVGYMQSVGDARGRGTPWPRNLQSRSIATRSFR